MERYLLTLTLMSLCQTLIALCPMQPSGKSATTESSILVKVSVPPFPPTETVPPKPVVHPKSQVPPKPVVHPKSPVPPRASDSGMSWPWSWYGYNWYQNSPYEKYNSGNMQTAGSHAQLQPGYPGGSLPRDNYPMASMTRPKFDVNAKFYDNNGYPMVERLPIRDYPRPYEYIMDSAVLDVSNDNVNSNSNVNVNSNVEKTKRRSRKGSAS